MTGQSELLSIANEIKHLEASIYEQQKEIEGLINALKKLELSHLDTVENAIDSSGKKVFTNERSRKAEVDRRLSKLAVWLDVTNKLEAYKDAQKKALIELDYKKRVFRIHEIVSRAGQ